MRFGKNRRRLRIEAFKQWANVKNEEKVLDVGGGSYPITKSALVVDITRPKTNNQWIQEDLDSFDTHKKFDVVVFSASLYYSKNPLILLKRAKKWLKQSGRLELAVFVPGKVKVTEPIFYSWTESTLRNLLGEAGYKKIRFTRFKTPRLSLPIFSEKYGKRIFCEAWPERK